MFEPNIVPYLSPEVAQRNHVCSGAIIDPRATIGRDNYFGPGCIIGPGVSIGDRNRFEAYVMVGTPAENRGNFVQWGLVRIGDGNIFREFVTIHAGVKRATSIHNGVTMLTKSHLGHDGVLEDDVMVSCSAIVGGHSHVMRGANLGLGAIIHQNQVIGSWAMVGMGTVVTLRKHVFPGTKVVGNPSRSIGMNTPAINRFAVSEEFFRAEEDRYELIQRGYGRKAKVLEPDAQSFG